MDQTWLKTVILVCRAFAYPWVQDTGVSKAGEGKAEHYNRAVSLIHHCKRADLIFEAAAGVINAEVGVEVQKLYN